MTREILLVGNDPSLLSTRARIVEALGVKAASCGPNGIPDVDLHRYIAAMLCHSLTPEQTTAIMRQIRETSPGTRVVKIRALYNAAHAAPRSIDELGPMPGEMVRYVSDLLAKAGGRDDTPDSRMRA